MTWWRHCVGYKVSITSKGHDDFENWLNCYIWWNSVSFARRRCGTLPTVTGLEESRMTRSDANRVRRCWKGWVRFQTMSTLALPTRTWPAWRARPFLPMAQTVEAVKRADARWLRLIRKFLATNGTRPAEVVQIREGRCPEEVHNSAKCEGCPLKGFP